MKKSTTYIPQGVCSQLIDVVVENGKVSSVQFIGGCHGNTQGVAALAVIHKVSAVLFTALIIVLLLSKTVLCKKD